LIQKEGFAKDNSLLANAFIVVVAFGMAYLFAVGVKSLINSRKAKLE